jgi:uncharacterized membrane protein
MTTSRSKKHARTEIKIVLLLIAGSIALVFPLLQFILSIAVFAFCGILVLHRLNPNADIIEHLTAGVLIGLTIPALLIYLSNMFLGMRVSFLSVMLALLFTILLGGVDFFKKKVF